jgi:prefoldin subunit 5
VDIVQIIADFGFSVVMVVGLGYFVFFVWTTITEKIDPSVEEMKATIIRLTDQLRLLDQDMIRLQQKVNTVLEVREKEGRHETAESKNKKQEGIRRVD